MTALLLGAPPFPLFVGFRHAMRSRRAQALPVRGMVR